jgi:hypothetical protein
VHIPVSTWRRRRLRARLHPLARDQQSAVHPRTVARYPAGAPGAARCARAQPLRRGPNEGWRGESATGITDAQGCFTRYKIVDPSFHNWTGLAYALRDQEISDFPLCNKSFNLSYCGHDL